ncbi:MAG TPA: glutathione S-transferase family protein [Steroidobacteraceae bacterium]|nr:glutathione S-transferase family protein [Steroidobacteraceae bacterium]
MNEFVIHSIPGSPFGRAVLVALEEKGVHARLAPVAPGTFRTPEHLARHPFGRVPVMDHGGFRLYESAAILRYLDRILPEPQLTPSSPEAAARMDQLMNINDWYLFHGVANVIGFQRIVGPRLMGLTPDEGAIAAAMPKAHTVFDELARQLSDKAYFVGDSITLADVLLAPQLDFFTETPEWELLTAKNRNLRTWLDRMNARPSMAATTWERVAAMAKAA